MEKFFIRNSILKNTSSTQDKNDDYNSRPNSSIPQDSCIIIIILFYFLFFCDVCNDHPKKNSWNRHCLQARVQRLIAHLPLFIY